MSLHVNCTRLCPVEAMEVISNLTFSRKSSDVLSHQSILCSDFLLMSNDRPGPVNIRNKYIMKPLALKPCLVCYALRLGKIINNLYWKFTWTHKTWINNYHDLGVANRMLTNVLIVAESALLIRDICTKT